MDETAMPDCDHAVIHPRSQYAITPRRCEVAGLVAAGMSDAEIAAALGIARSTVRSLRTPAHGARAKGTGTGWWRK